MGPNWQQHRIADLIRENVLFIGDGYRAKNEELGSVGLPFARVGNINDGFLFSDADRFPPENLGRVGTKVSRPYDVVFTSKGTVGRFAFVDEHVPEFIYSPQLCFWRVLDPTKIVPRFLYYWMFGREFYLQYNGVRAQTDMADYVSLIDQRRMHITLPPLFEQRTIANILGTLDDKIGLNRQMNATLEAMAQALFNSWFVDFDPVRAKMVGRRPAGMDDATAALFPDGFEESALGEVPKGWKVKPLGECVTYLSRGVAPSYVLASHIRALNQRAIRWWHIDESVLKFHDPNKPVRNDAYIRKGDVVINSTGDITIGRGYWFHHDVEHLFADSHVSIARTDPSMLLPEMIVFQLETPRHQDLIYGHVTGSTGQLELNRSNLARVPFLCPNLQAQAAYSSTIKPWFALVWQNKQKGSVLTSIRDALLPKLLSGEIRVMDAGAFAEAVS